MKGRNLETRKAWFKSNYFKSKISIYFVHKIGIVNQKENVKVDQEIRGS